MDRIDEVVFMVIVAVFLMAITWFWPAYKSYEDCGKMVCVAQKSFNDERP